MQNTDQQAAFIESHGGDLSPEQAAALLDMALDGDTGDAPDTGSPPKAAPDTEAGDGDQHDADNTVILARDGKHTISYDKLVEAREASKQLKAQLDAAQQQLAQLQAAAQARADAGQQATLVDQQVAAAEDAIAAGADPDLFGDFSEEALAKGIQKLVDQQVAARVQQAMRPMEAKQAVEAAEAHYKAIYERHPDADSILESKELSNWIEAQPDFMQKACLSVLNEGSAAQVNALFDQFKGATARPAAQQAVKQAAAKAPVTPPASLTDFPAGRGGAAASQNEVLDSLDPVDLMDRMSDMTPEQIERYLNRRL